jgi:hypothetical protein
MEPHDRELLVRIDERVGHLVERTEVQDTRLNDHSTRIRTLENWRWKVIGIMLAVGALAGFVWG